MAYKGKKKRGGVGGRRRGIGGAISSAVIMVLLISAVIGWARVNNIDSPTAALDYFRDWSGYMTECGAQEAEWNCDTMLPIGDGGDGETSPEEAEEQKSQAVASLAALTVSEPNEVDYDRSSWRHWSGSPCNTREETLISQGKDVETNDDCSIASGEWLDPFTGDMFTNSSDLDIDHLIPLGYAARHGGHEWSADRKEEFANDQSQLLAVSASANRSKGDSGPDEYMPDVREYHCEYSKIWVNTADKYGLSIAPADHEALEKGLETC